MRTPLKLAAGLVLATTAVSAQAEVVEADESHFITRAEAIVEATPTETWLALISPARWWSDEHTWSADAANMSLVPQAGGCFCERIPEVDEPGRFTLEGSVEHMRVIQAYPEVALRMQGALGPLQSEPVIGILTIAISEAEEGTRIVWEYNVGGQMRYPGPAISSAVDGVMTLQLSRLSELLGQVRGPAGVAASDETVPDEAPATIDPEAVINEPGSRVDEVFGDLGGEG